MTTKTTPRPSPLATMVANHGEAVRDLARREAAEGRTLYCDCSKCRQTAVRS